MNEHHGALLSTSEADFDGQPVEKLILSNATVAKGRVEFDVSINLQDDNAREPDEYFLLVLDAPSVFFCLCNGSPATPPFSGQYG